MSVILIPTPEEFAREMTRVVRALVAAGPEVDDDEIAIFTESTLLTIGEMISAAQHRAVSAERTRIRERAEHYLEAIREGPFSPSARAVTDVALSIRIDEAESPGA